MALVVLFTFHLVVIFFLSFWVWEKQGPEVRPFFWPALTLKLAAGIVLGLLYKYHYAAGDTFGFFEDASKLTKVFWVEPGVYIKFLFAGDELDPVWATLSNTQSRSLFLVKIISIVNLSTGNTYWITCLYFSLVSFGAAFLLFSRISVIFPGSKVAAAIAFLFFPSVVFWSSGIIKECLALAGLLVISVVYVKMLTNSKTLWWEWLLAFISAIVVWRLKYYWFAVFVPVTITTMAIHLVTQRWKVRMSIKILLWIGSFFIFCFGVTLVHPNFYLDTFLTVLVENYNEFTRIESQGKIIHYQLEPSWWSVIRNSPLALVSGLFRPFIWEVTNFLQAIVAAENLITLILLATRLSQMKSVIQSSHRLLIFSVVAYIGILCVFLALSTPNLGTLARYKVGFQSFLVFVLLTDNLVVGTITAKLENFFSKRLTR
jgi:hypothetical protein